MRISSVSSTYCFVHVDGQPAQVVRVAVADAPTDVEAAVSIEGRAVSARPWRGRLDPARTGHPSGPAWTPSLDAGLALPSRYSPLPGMPEGVVVEVPVVFQGRSAGDLVDVRCSASAGGTEASLEAQVVVRDPGWRMVMVPHFHYDPVWWNTQAAYTSGWDELLWAQERRDSFQHTGLTLVEAHLERAREDPRYKFVLAEVDYLKPYWDLYPDRRQELRALVDAGRLEIVGGTYNEPNTNLTGAETAVRAAVYGLGFQRDVMGADPQSAWQLDVFGHDPQFPGIMAECGLTSSSWARGPFHQWGPKHEVGDNNWMQFPSEFEWVAPNGRGLLTSYMPNHYSSGWEVERATTLEGSMWLAYQLFCDLAEVSATKWTLLPVGTDYTPPSRFVTELASKWGERYLWPRFSVGLPSEFFAGVRQEMAHQGRSPSPQSRDMNPVYTGKDVSFIDTKQAQRQAECHLAEAEALSALASVLGHPVAHRALDKAWRQLVFGAHHDGITGSESDQVYLDLLGGWREAWDLARGVEETCRALVAGAVTTTGDGPSLVVTNTLGDDRSGLVSVEVGTATGGSVPGVLGPDGQDVPVLAEPGRAPSSRRLSFLARDVPGVGYRTYRLAGAARRAASAWASADGVSISNEHMEVRADPERGGGLAGITDRASGFELVPPGEVANELVTYPEYPEHPRFGEGPWNLLPCGPPDRTRTGRAEVRREVCDLGERLVVDGWASLSPHPVHDGARGPRGGARPEGFRYRHVVTLWQGATRLELRTEVHDWSARDRLVRLRVPTVLAGASALSAVGDAVVGRGFGLIDADSAVAPWTLDNPAAEWFGLSTPLVVEAADGGGPAYYRRSVAVAELVTPPGEGAAAWARDLVVALVRKGVTSTCSEAPSNRYGALRGDSNLPDFRVAVGTPEQNQFVAAVLAAAGPQWSRALSEQLDSAGHARLLVPSERPLDQVWAPNADLRGPLDIPVLVVAATGPDGAAAAAGALCDAIGTARVQVSQPRSLGLPPAQVPEWSAALFNRGTPSFAVDAGGALHVSLLRACTGWPSGIWIDPPRRSAPDGSAFELEHWSHVFEHALVMGRGDWRSLDFVGQAQDYNRPLRAVVEKPHEGTLPAEARLLELRVAAAAATPEGAGAGRPLLACLKPAGNALASGDDPAPTGPDGARVSVRVYEAAGSAVPVEIRSAFAMSEARHCSLDEVPGRNIPLDGGRHDKTVALTLSAGQIATVQAQLARSGAGGRPASALAALGRRLRELDVEPAQPVFSRYWLHNKGPAPMGNQAVAVHVLQQSVAVRAGDEGRFSVQVASGSSRDVRAGRVEVVGPAEWAFDPPSRLFSLAARAYLSVEVHFRVPYDTRPGRRFVAARVVDGAGQLQEDVVTVDVLPHLAEAASATHPLLASPPPFSHPSGELANEVEASLATTRLSLRPGDQGELALVLANNTQGDIRGEVQLLSPVETWPWTGPASQAFAVGPHAATTVTATVQAPPDEQLTSWALFKVTYYGRLWYSPAIALHLGGPGGAEAGGAGQSADLGGQAEATNA